MNWVEQQRNRTPGEYGAHYPPNIIKGHVTYTVSPFYQPVMKGWLSDFAKRLVRGAPRKAILVTPALMFAAAQYFFVTTGVAHEHHEKYW